MIRRPMNQEKVQEQLQGKDNQSDGVHISDDGCSITDYDSDLSNSSPLLN